MEFYIKVKSKQVNLVENAILTRVESLFNRLSTQEKDEWFNGATTFDFGWFNNYTSYIEDTATGDRYYNIHDLAYGVGGERTEYNFAQWFIDTYPSYPRYDYDYVKQFLPEEGI